MEGWSVLLLFLLVAAVFLWLQVKLSSLQHKWPGLVLPCVSFGVSLLAVLGVGLFTAVTGTTTGAENGIVAEQVITQVERPSNLLFMAGYVFLLYNIPTAALLVIYKAMRKGRKEKRDVDRMSIQDLE